MIKVGVQVPGDLADPGDYLADARALEAAGVDSIWLERGALNPWMLLAGIAAVTGRIRLAAALSPWADGPPPRVLSSAQTLQRLSRDRGLVAFIEGSPPGDAEARLGQFVEALRSHARCGILVEATSEAGCRWAARLADGLVLPSPAPDGVEATFARVRAMVERERSKAAFERWTHVPAPGDREDWRRALQGSEAAGATGVIVPFGPRLLDILRRPDQEDDRSDLLLSQG